MQYVLNIASIMFIAAGLFFATVAAIGVLRLPDVFSRLHVVGVMDTLGAPLIFIGAAMHEGLSLTSGKLVLAGFFLYMVAPLVGHLLSRAALEAGLHPVLAPHSPAHAEALDAIGPPQSSTPDRETTDSAVAP